MDVPHVLWYSVCWMILSLIPSAAAELPQHLDLQRSLLAAATFEGTCSPRRTRRFVFQIMSYLGSVVSAQQVGAYPCGCSPGQAQGLPLPQDIEKIRFVFQVPGQVYRERG
jgi:hypothetical protein